MLDQGLMNTLSRLQLQFFQSYAYKLIQEKVTVETKNYENLTGSICECQTSIAVISGRMGQRTMTAV
jgi:hypothetical protein